MTNREKMERYFRETDVEAERYRDKQMDPTRPGMIAAAFLIGQVVYLKVGDAPTRGMVTDFDVHPYGIVYHVCWGDTRQTTPHYDFELTAEKPAPY
jgi:hypothetical protein